MYYSSAKEQARPDDPTNNIQNANHSISLKTNTLYTAKREKQLRHSPEAWAKSDSSREPGLLRLARHEALLQGNLTVSAPATSLAQSAQIKKN